MDCLWRLDPDGAPSERRILPDGCIDLIHARQHGVADKLFWVGAMPTAEVVHVDASAALVGIRFRPGAAPAFLGMPADELTGQRVDAADLWPEAIELDDALATARSTDAVGRALLSALLERLPRARALDGAMMRWAAQALQGPPDAPNAPPRELGARQMRRRFKAAVGIGPKHFARIARLHWVLQRASPPVRWADLAQAAGYHDQAHLIREFVGLTGTTPAAYLRATR